MEAERKMTIPDHVMARQVGDETVILDLGSGHYFGLDPVGARIWRLVEEGRSVPQIVATLLDEYEVTADQLQRDVDALLDDLVTRGLLEVSR